jgi:signal transduction histidine kinase
MTAAALASADDPPMPAARRVLIVDDDVAMARLVARSLARAGWTVVHVADGVEAVRLLRDPAIPPLDVVALDHYMPGQDGLQTLEQIRATVGDPPPVVYVTGTEEGRVAVAALKAGATDYVVKEASDSFFMLLAAALDAAVSQVELRRRKEEAERELRLAKEMAERASGAKSRLLASTGHDLRQPLSVVTMALDMLEMDIEPAEGTRPNRMLKVARRAVGTLDRAFENLMQAARLESGAISPNLQSFPIGELLAEIVEAWQLTAAEKGIEIRLVPCSASVRSDREMLRTVFHNLVGNAVKYTEKGRVLVGARRLRNGLAVEVLDSGVGIPDAELPHIFEEFRQLDTSRARGGVGLGLSIVRGTLDGLGHHISVRSKVGHGSRFTVRLG